VALLSDLWRPSVRRNDRRVRVIPGPDRNELAGFGGPATICGPGAISGVDPTSAFDVPTYANRSLHADVPFALEIRELLRADPVGSRTLVRAEIRRVVDYCAKLGLHR
jgi:hypothetical protein